MGNAKKILKGKFPEKTLTLDEQVLLINKIGDRLFEDFTTGLDEAKIDAKVNNFALWLGGLHPDLQVYAFQLLLNFHQIEFDADEKTEARMARLEERISIGTKPGLKEYSYDRIHHYPWPVEFLDGTTFEDRLEALAEELEEPVEDRVTVDMILSGTAPQRQLEIPEAYALTVASCHALKDTQESFGLKPIFYERFDNFAGWLQGQGAEITVMGLRMAIQAHKLPGDTAQMPQFVKALDNFKDVLQTS